ncbi:MAG: hypothetical protein J4431_02565 [Candidatus Aenigmarchaeota archaeon]|nr:hypothetical protein [Candidatus Aenigmarchaeota archaeon]
MIISEEEIKHDAKMLPVCMPAFLDRSKWNSVAPKVNAKRALDPYPGAMSCPDEAITVENGKMKINYSACTGCLVCLRETPFNAISEEKVNR